MTISNFTVLETETSTQFPDALGHLPPASNPLLVEIVMKDLVSEKTLKSFSGQLQKRDKARKQKAAREERYSVKVDKVASKKFEDLKK